MKVKAVKGFSGFLSTGEAFSMYSEETREVENNSTVSELISIGYLQEEQSDQEKPTRDAPADEETVSDVPPDEVKLDEAKRSKSKRN